MGTLLCGIANTYPLLLGARIITGLFGGVIGSISMAIVADLFDLQHRGRVMGFMQMGFGASQVLGIPIGLYLANIWGWHAPFLGGSHGDHYAILIVVRSTCKTSCRAAGLIRAETFVPLQRIIGSGLQPLHCYPSAVL